MKTKLLALVLALLMVTSMVPVSAIEMVMPETAAEDTVTIPESAEEIATVAGEARPYSTSYGESIYFDDFESYTTGSTIADGTKLYYVAEGYDANYQSVGSPEVYDDTTSNKYSGSKMLKRTINNTGSWAQPYFKIQTANADKKGKYTMVGDFYNGESSYSGRFVPFLNNTAGTASKIAITNGTMVRSFELPYMSSGSSIADNAYGINWNIEATTTPAANGGTELVYYMDNIELFFKPLRTASYVLDGGSGTFNSFTYYDYEAVTLPETAPTKVGSAFAGWLASTSGKTYAAGATIPADEIGKATDALTLTAVWEETLVMEYSEAYGENIYFENFESFDEDEIISGSPAYVADGKTVTFTNNGEYKAATYNGSMMMKFTPTTAGYWKDVSNWLKINVPMGTDGKYTVYGEWYAPTGVSNATAVNLVGGQAPQNVKGSNAAHSTNNAAAIAGNTTPATYAWSFVFSSNQTNLQYGVNMSGSATTISPYYLDNIALYFKPTRTASYVLDGGSGTFADFTYYDYEAVTLPETAPTKTDYAFAGWKASTSGKIYAAGATIPASEIGKATDALTLTATWKRAFTPVKTAQILEEEKVYGECLFFDDFENYVVNEVPAYVYYSKLGETSLYKADQCGEIKIVDGIGDNGTQVIELTGNGTEYKYPFIRVGYKLEKQGKYTMLADMYTEAPGSKWSFFNGYSGTGGQTDKRIMYNTGVFHATWQPVESECFTTDIEGLTSINYFGFGASGVGNGEKIYIDNIRVYYKESYEAEFVSGEGAEGDAPVLKYAAFDTITMPKNTFTKEGYVFAGWRTNLGNRIYQEDEKFTLGNIDELTLTAIWTKFVPQLVRKNSIRDTDDGIQGMRFAGYVSNEDKVYASEIGFIVTRAELLGDSELCFGDTNENGAGISPDGVKYIYGVTYDKAAGTDIIYSTSGDVFGSDIWKDVEGTFFTSVITGIPESAYKDKFVVRPYALIDDMYVYGEAMKRSVCDVAENAYNDGNRDAYVMNILEKTGITPGKKVCFVGDSITHDGRYIKELAQTYLDTDKNTPRYEFYNCGVSGDTAGGALKRYDSNIIMYDPDIVIVMFGMNDIGRHYYIKANYSEEMEVNRKAQLDRYKENMTTLIDKFLDEGIEVILCTPTPFDDISTPTYDCNVGLEACAEFVRETAKAKNLQVIDHYANMYPLRGTKYWNTDAVHPNTLGQHVIAQSIMYSLGYVDEMDVSIPMGVFDELNEQRHTISYDYQMVMMVDRNLINGGYTTVEAKKAAAATSRDNPQTSDYMKSIYQDYIDNIDNIVEMREEMIRLTEEMSYKH